MKYIKLLLPLSVLLIGLPSISMAICTNHTRPASDDQLSALSGLITDYNDAGPQVFDISGNVLTPNTAIDLITCAPPDPESPPELDMSQPNENNVPIVACPPEVSQTATSSSQDAIKGDFVRFGNLDQTTAGNVAICVAPGVSTSASGGMEAPVSVQTCINGDRPAQDHSPMGTYCSEGHYSLRSKSAINSGIVFSDTGRLTRQTTIGADIVSGSTCTLVCLPPTLTFAGTGKSCGYVCK